MIGALVVGTLVGLAIGAAAAGVISVAILFALAATLILVGILP